MYTIFVHNKFEDKLRMIFQLLVLTYVSHPVFGQWEAVHPSSSFNKSFYYAYSTPNQKNYYAIGNYLVTYDATKWKLNEDFKLPEKISSYSNYSDIYFCNESIGYFINNNKIYKTIDRGSDWIKVLELTPNNNKYTFNPYFLSLFFLDDSKGYAVGEFGKIFKTEDGGATWNNVSWSNLTAPYIRYTDVYFINDQVGFISGFEVPDIVMKFGFTHFIIKTIDGGKTWARYIIPTGFDYSSVKMKVITKDIWFVHLCNSQSNDETYITTNGGVNWKKNSPAALRKIKNVCWTNERIGLAYGTGNNYEMQQLYRTEDAGISWLNISIPVFASQDENIIADFAFSDENNGFAVGAGGNIIITSDGGKTWQSENKGYPIFRTFCFSSKDVGFASSGRGFFKTKDGGLSWDFQEKSDSLTFLHIESGDGEKSFFSGFQSNFFRVEKGGGSIKTMKLPVRFTFESKLIIRERKIYMGGPGLVPKGNIFLKSEDWGATWVSVIADAGAFPIVDFEFPASDILYLGTSRHLLKSEDGGAVWHKIFDFDPNHYGLQSLGFINADVGLGSFHGGQILRTVDAGKSWNLLSSFPNNVSIKDFMIINDKIAFAYGSKGIDGNAICTIWKSEDSGANWVEEILPDLIDGQIEDMALNGETIYATGGYGQIFKLEIPTGLIHPKTTPGINIFPVPASDYIKFTIPQNTKPKSATLYSSTGISYQNVSFKKAAENYVLDLSKIPPGIFIIKIATDKAAFQKRIEIH